MGFTTCDRNMLMKILYITLLLFEIVLLFGGCIDIPMVLFFVSVTAKHSKNPGYEISEWLT